MSRPQHPGSARILKVYIEFLTGLSHIHHPDSLSISLPSQGCVFGQARARRRPEEHTFQGWGGSEGPPTAWVKSCVNQRHVLSQFTSSNKRMEQILQKSWGKEGSKRRNIKNKCSKVIEWLALRRKIKNENVAGMSLEQKREMRAGDREVTDVRSSKVHCKVFFIRVE